MVILEYTTRNFEGSHFNQCNNCKWGS